MGGNAANSEILAVDTDGLSIVVGGYIMDSNVYTRGTAFVASYNFNAF